MIKYLNELSAKDLKGKKVFLRVDFDVPVKDGIIEEGFRILSHKDTINYLIENGAKVLLASHISATDTFLPIVEQIGEILDSILTLVPLTELTSADVLFEASNLLLLENLRQDPREIKNDDGFAKELAGACDYYVNDAFAVSHREHASVSAITKLLPSYAGFLIKNEVEGLARIIDSPAEGKVLVIAGAKISTKLPVIKNFLDKAEKILIGGALANSFFKFDGIDVGKSVVDDESLHLLAELGTTETRDKKIILPQDILISKDGTGKAKIEAQAVANVPEQMIVDIGPETAKNFSEIIKNSKETVWNGPLGLSEIGKFMGGTRAVAEAVAQAKYSVMGGGDTILAVDSLGLLNKMDFISTGGGAMLEFLAGNRLPGLESLGYYNK
jgi:phosphoglycerate kinase